MSNIRPISDSEIALMNKQLSELYGTCEERGKRFGLFRVVWSEDILETRLHYTSPEGFHYVRPKMEQRRKYAGMLKDKYVLESVKEVPILQANQLTTELSYEPLWVFEAVDVKGDILPPNMRVLRFLIEHVLKRQETAGFYNEKNPEATPEEAAAFKEARVKELMEELFGNETRTGDSLAHKSGVGYTKGSH